MGLDDPRFLGVNHPVEHRRRQAGLQVADIEPAVVSDSAAQRVQDLRHWYHVASGVQLAYRGVQVARGIDRVVEQTISLPLPHRRTATGGRPQTARSASENTLAPHHVPQRTGMSALFAVSNRSRNSWMASSSPSMGSNRMPSFSAMAVSNMKAT